MQTIRVVRSDLIEEIAGALQSNGDPHIRVYVNERGQVTSAHSILSDNRGWYPIFYPYDVTLVDGPDTNFLELASDLVKYDEEELIERSVAVSFNAATGESVNAKIEIVD